MLQGFEGSLDYVHGHGFGHPTILDRHYESIGSFRGGNHKLISIHEFRIVEERTALVEVYRPEVRDLERWGGDEGQNWIVDAVVQGEKRVLLVFFGTD